MTSSRFDFQRSCAKLVDGRILNVGCNDDPGGIKSVHPDTVNCDFITYDKVIQKQTAADKLFDCTKDRWPFLNDDADLVIMGDILEHLTHSGQMFALNEAHRCAPLLCITVPNDPRWEKESEEDKKDRPAGSYHIITVTEAHLRDLLKSTGWRPIRWRTVDYGFVPEGYFVLAARAPFFGKSYFTDELRAGETWKTTTSVTVPE